MSAERESLVAEVPVALGAPAVDLVPVTVPFTLLPLDNRVDEEPEPALYPCLP
jgi:hypothetical protein